MNANIPAVPKGEAAWKRSWAQLARGSEGALGDRRGIPIEEGRDPWLEPLAQTRAKFWQIGGTYVLDNVLEASVYLPINVGLQEIGLGLATPEQVAANTQKAYDAWKAAQK